MSQYVIRNGNSFFNAIYPNSNGYRSICFLLSYSQKFFCTFKTKEEAQETIDYCLKELDKIIQDSANRSNINKAIKKIKSSVITEVKE